METENEQAIPKMSEPVVYAVGDKVIFMPNGAPEEKGVVTEVPEGGQGKVRVKLDSGGEYPINQCYLKKA